MISEFHKQGLAFYLYALLDSEEKEIIGVANFSNVVRGRFIPATSATPSGRSGKGRG